MAFPGGPGDVKCGSLVTMLVHIGSTWLLKPQTVCICQANGQIRIPLLITSQCMDQMS